MTLTGTLLLGLLSAEAPEASGSLAAPPVEPAATPARDVRATALNPEEVTAIRAVTEDMTPTSPPPDHRLIEGRDYVVCFFGTSTPEERYAVAPQTAEMMPAGTNWIIQRVQADPWSLRAR